MKTDTIICLTGPSGCGKSTVAKVLHKAYGFNLIKSYTTRSPRHEYEDDLIFVDDDFYNSYIESNLRSNMLCETVYGGHRYWADKTMYKNKGISVFCIDIPGIQRLKEVATDAIIIVVFVYADADIVMKRLAEERKMFTNLDIKAAPIVQIQERMNRSIEQYRCVECDFVLFNNCSLDTTIEQFKKMIN